MSKPEIIQDRIEMDKNRVVFEFAMPLDFLRESMKTPENMERAFAMAFADAMKSFLVRKNISQPSKKIVTEE